MANDWSNTNAGHPELVSESEKPAHEILKQVQDDEILLGDCS